MFLGFALQENPTSVATFGLGGGAIARTFARHLPSVSVEVAEIDPLVARLAHEYFGFRESANVHLSIADGRQFLRKSNKTFDQILLDAYNSEYVPAHMMTREFLLEVRRHLNPGGLVFSNLIRGNRLFLAEVATYRDVFRSVRVLRSMYNTVIVAGDGELPATREELARAVQRSRRAIPGVDLSHVADSLIDVQTGDAPILTDDYGPANLLLQRAVANP
jgi:spermidine synthase